MSYKDLLIGPFFPKSPTAKPDARTDGAFEASSGDAEPDKVQLDMATGASIFKGLPQPGTVTETDVADEGEK